jgi:uncharacterized protein (DUF2164 family)
MSSITFDRHTRETLSRLIVRRLKDAHDVEIYPTDGDDLLTWLSETLGPYFYNQGLDDAQALIRSRVDTVLEAVADLEKPLTR